MFFKHGRECEPDTGLIINKQNTLARRHLSGLYSIQSRDCEWRVYPTRDKNYVQHSTFRERILGKSSTKQASGGLDGALAKCLGSGSQREARRGSLLQRIEGTIRAGDINHFPLNYRRGKNGPRAEELPDPDHHVVVEALGHYD